MDRKRFLSCLGADALKWARRYGIEPLTAPCSSCGADLLTTIPFAFESLRGLAAPTCQCGNDATPYCWRSPESAEIR